MAIVTTKPLIRREKVLKPGEAEWVQLGESKEFEDAAVIVTATPYGGTDGYTHVLKVENVNITCIDRPDTIPATFHAGCNVVNNGKTTINYWAVRVAIIKA